MVRPTRPASTGSRPSEPRKDTSSRSRLGPQTPTPRSRRSAHSRTRDFDERRRRAGARPHPGTLVRTAEGAPPGGLHGHPASPGIAIGAARRFHVPALDDRPMTTPPIPGAESRGARSLRSRRPPTRSRHQRAAVAARAASTGGRDLRRAPVVPARRRAAGDPRSEAIASRGRPRRGHGATSIERTAGGLGSTSTTTTCERAPPTCAASATQVLARLARGGPARPRAPGRPGDPGRHRPLAGRHVGARPVDGPGHRHRPWRSDVARCGPGPRRWASPRSWAWATRSFELVRGNRSLAPRRRHRRAARRPRPGRPRASRGRTATAAAALRARGAVARPPHRPSRSTATTIEVAANVGRARGGRRRAVAGRRRRGRAVPDGVPVHGPGSRCPTRTSRRRPTRAAAEALDGRPLLLRTLDAGADKPIPYLDQPPEPNPFLGVRGVRLGLARPDVARRRSSERCSGWPPTTRCA